MRAKSIMFVIIAIIAILSLLTPNVQAGGGNVTGQYSNNVLQWTFDSPTMPSKLSEIFGAIIKFLRDLSLILTVVVITLLGVKYMMGSVEEKADYKKDYINIVMGAGVIAGVMSIIDVIFSTTSSLM